MDRNIRNRGSPGTTGRRSGSPWQKTLSITSFSPPGSFGSSRSATLRRWFSKTGVEGYCCAKSGSPAPRELEAASTEGEEFFRASAYFDLTADEALYGLGQHQSGLLNQRGTDLLLMQDNTNITVPFLLSSRGYGLLWNSASLGRYENHFQPKLALRSEMADGVDYYFLYGRNATAS